MIRVVFGQGMKRSDIGEQLQNQTWQAMVCLTQLYLYPDSDTRNHWITELWNKYVDLPAVKGHGKPITSRFIFEHTFPTQKKTKTDRLIGFVEDKEDKSSTRNHVSQSELMYLIYNYFMWMSKTLSTQEVIQRSQVDMWLRKHNM